MGVGKGRTRSLSRVWQPSLAILAAAIAVQGHVAQAQTSPPVTKRLIGTAISPADAFAYYGTDTTHTNGVAHTAQRPPEIRALARALSRDGALTGDAFIQRVADYVRRNIETEFMFGLGKGARGAAIDQSGTVFDQAELMVEILREKEQTASYQLGSITLTSDQFGKWTGLVNGLNQSAQTFTVNAQAACQMLADGGIPAIVNGSTSCTALAGSNLSSVTLAHLWVVTGGKAYDPGFKINVLKAGVDLPEKMGCGNLAAPTCGNGIVTAAVIGATQGNTPAPWIQKVNQTGVEDYIQARAVTLQGAIEAIDPTSSLVDILGGKEIDTGQVTAGATTLPYSSGVQPHWGGAIPDKFRTKFRIQFMGIDQVVFADELAGKRVRIKTKAADFGSFVRNSELRIEGALVASGTVTAAPLVNDTLIATVDHPFASAVGAYADEALTLPLGLDTRSADGCIVFPTGSRQCAAPYASYPALLLDVGKTGPNRAEYFSKLARNEVELAAMPSDPDQAFYPVRLVHTTMANHQAQSSQFMKLVEGTAKVLMNHLHTVSGIFLNTTLGDDPIPPHFGYTVGPTPEPYINSVASLTTTSVTALPYDERGSFEATAAAFAALEGNVTRQSNDAWEGVDVISVLKLENAQVQAPIKFYLADSSNISQTLNASTTTNYNSRRKSDLIQYANDGYTLIVPSSGKPANLTLPPSVPPTTLFFGTGPSVAFKSNEVGYLIDEHFKGGGFLTNVNPLRDALDTAVTRPLSERNRKNYGVDLASGSLNVSNSADISVGLGAGRIEFVRKGFSPGSMGLRCEREWVLFAWFPNCSHLANPLSPLSGGWGNNQEYSASWSGSGLEGLGITTAARSAKSIAAAYGFIDIARAGPTPTVSQRMAGVLTIYSLMDNFVRNSVSLKNMGEFIRLPDGRYDQPFAARGSVLAITGQPSQPYYAYGSIRRYYEQTSIGLVSNEGATITYSPAEGLGYSLFTACCKAMNQPRYGAINRSDATGIKTMYGYEEILSSNSDGTFTGKAKNLLKSVTNSFGNGLYLSYKKVDEPSSARRMQIVSIANSAGVSVNYECGSGCFKNPENGISAIDLLAPTLDPNSLYMDEAPIAFYTPSDLINPYLRVTYDPLQHVVTLQDNQNRTSKYFTASVANERLRIGDEVDALGQVMTKEFNSFSSPIKITDSLGRVTKNVYDTAQRLLRTVFPEGNAVEYQYDVRGNQTRECKIAKGRVTWSSLTALNERNPQCNESIDLVSKTTYVGGPTLRADQCANMKTCNKVSYVVDPKGNRTDYEWSGVHGQLTRETKPADVSGNTPVTTFEYGAFTGVETTNPATFYLLTAKVETISPGVTTRTIYEYDAANKFVLKSQVVDSGSGGLALRTCLKFDATGNLISKTEPKAGLTSCP